jgi:hypothetical protein
MAGKARPLQQYLLPAKLKIAVVVRRKSIEADDLMAFVEKTASHVKTNKAGAAGNENTHCSRNPLIRGLTARANPVKALGTRGE